MAPLDSLQLSTAIPINSNEEEIKFITADQDLEEIADKKGLNSLNPEEKRN